MPTRGLDRRTALLGAWSLLAGFAGVAVTAAADAGVGAAPGGTSAADRAPLTVFAAASLTDALGEVTRAFTAATGTPVRTSFAASSALARQIEAGAPADLYFSADREWMDHLESRGALRAGTRRDALGNRLVLIAPADSAIGALAITPHFALAAALGRGRLATGDPDAVPVGRYARQALERLGVWNEVADRLVRAEDVRSALAFVDRGEAPLGIVYATDAGIDRRVRIVGEFPADSHAPIVYPVALTARSRPQAAALLAFIVSPAADAIFTRYGFSPLH